MHKTQHVLPESQQKCGPDGKHFSTLGQPQMFLAIEHCSGQLLYATTGKSPLQWHSRSLNREVVFHDLRHSGILNRVVLSKVRLDHRQNGELCMFMYTPPRDHVINILQRSCQIILKFLTRAAAYNIACQMRLTVIVSHIQLWP